MWFRQTAALSESEFPSASPPAERRWLWWCLVAFGFSFVFDYQAPDIEFGSEKTGGSVFQFGMIGLATASGFLSIWIGWRHLLVRPAAYFLLAWWGYLAFAVIVSVLHGNELGRIVRLMVAPLLIGLGFTTTHLAVCSGVPARRIVGLFLAMCMINVLWQTLFGYATTQKALSETRPELSPAVRFVFAWTAACVLLAKKIPLSSLVMSAVALLVSMLCLTRSAFIYMAAALSGAFVCMVLAMLWQRLTISHATRRMGTLALLGIASLVFIALCLLALPVLREWWMERFLYSDGGGATSEDMSVLMRKAEAKAMLDILKAHPVSFLWGQGFGAAYYWDDSFLPELFLVFPGGEGYPEEIYTLGHSVWTYALFATGALGVLSWALVMAGPALLSIRAGMLLCRIPSEQNEDRLHLVFFGAIALWTMLCSTILENPFDNRLAGPLTGMAAGMPQLFLNRAHWLMRRQRAPAPAQPPLTLVSANPLRP